MSNYYPSQCFDCMYLRKDWKQERLLQTYFRCTRFDQFVKGDSSACGEFVERKAGTAGGCYLSTACIKYYGLPDDCPELQTLRKFRDEYLKGTEDGERLILDYYNKAPQLVEQIEASEKQAQIYKEIYKKIQECISLINENKNEEAKNAYYSMANAIEKMIRGEC